MPRLAIIGAVLLAAAGPAVASDQQVAAASQGDRLLSPNVQIALVVAFTLCGSFFCSLFEAALYSITPAQVELLRRQQKFATDRLMRLRTEVDEPITAILTVNTIANTIGSAWSGALVGAHYGPYLGLFAGLLTLSILLFSEIVPKTLGVAYAQQIGPWMAWPLQVMVWAVWPIVKMCGALIEKLIGENGKVAPTEDEIIVASRLAFRGGHLRSQELAWVENALLLDKVKALELMTPRTVVYTLPADLKLKDVKKHSAHWSHSRLPLTEDRDPDKILGVVFRREVFESLVQGKSEETLRDLMHPVDFVPEAMRGHQLLDKFLKEKKHIVCVVDEYGGFEGVVTLEDVLECLIGREIVDEHDQHANMQQLARRRGQKLRDQKLKTAPTPHGSSSTTTAEI